MNTNRPIAVHESAHVVGGICLGRGNLLKRVHIIGSEGMKGGCVWDVGGQCASPQEQNEEFAVGFSGPIGQVLYAAESLGTYVDVFRSSILQPLDILEKAGVLGWATADLNHYLWRNREGHATDDLVEVEMRIRSLLARPSLEVAIGSLAVELEDKKDIQGEVAVNLVRRHLKSEDFVGRDYLDGIVRRLPGML